MNPFAYVTRTKASDLLVSGCYLGVTGAGAYLVASGHMEAGALGPFSIFLLLLQAVLCGVGYARPSQLFDEEHGPFPVLRDAGLLVLAWMLYRALFALLWQAALLPFLAVGFLLFAKRIGQLPIPLLVALGMEGGLYLSGCQSLTSLLAMLVCLALFIFFLTGRFAPYSLISARPRKEKQPELSSVKPPLSPFKDSYPTFEPLSETVTTENAIALFSDALQGLLGMAKQRLAAATIALLWPLSDGSYKVREIATDRRDLRPGPFPSDSGLLAALAQTDSITVNTPRHDGPRLPFYHSNEGISAFLVRRLDLPFHEIDSTGKKNMHALLTFDRAEEKPFAETDNTLIEQMVRQLKGLFTIEKNMRLVSLDRDRIQTVCQGLHQLNGVLGLQSVFDATTRIIRDLVPYDFLAISLLEKKSHRIAKIDGAISGVEEGQEFPVDDGLVGQVLKRNHWLPAGATYREPAPIFSNTIRHKEYKSLIVLPLRNEDNLAIGALVVAGKKAQLITRQRRDLLLLVATQVAVKIDLAQAHEKINLLATTDGLTGLSNHRTFQHGFDMMLERAKRNQCPLCLIICDIDHFKKVNDNYGHPFGDVVLKTVAGVFVKMVRRVDLAARYGGEEFALLLESADEKGGRMMAERIRTEIEKLVIIEGRKHIKTTISLGLSFFPKDSITKEQLISYADQALYKAKSRGRNRTVTWSEIAGIKEED